MNDRFPFEVVFLATRNGDLVGWTGVERQTENIGEISRWHPYVVNTPERDSVAESLLQEVIKYAKANGMNRLEISFGEISDDVVEAYKVRQSWLKALDWSLVEDTYYMEKEPCQEIPEITIPNSLKLEPLLENDNDSIYTCHHAAFLTSEAREFYDLSESERRQTFDKLYDRTQPINEQASLILKKDDDIVGILLVISREDEEYISVVAVHPDHRGQGLAKVLLTIGINRIREQGIGNISIGVDVVNTPAVSLYRKFGFKVRSRLSFHSWSKSD
jgi:ribosomal protein S18 acetylase RimI-like enzyme